MRLGNAKIQVFADDHAPPHFHLVGPESHAQIEIGSLRLLRGRASRRDLEEARAWARVHGALLERSWRELNERD